MRTSGRGAAAPPAPSEGAMWGRWAGVALATVLAAGLSAPTTAIAQTDPDPDGRYRGFGDAGGFLNVMPPGQDGTVSAAEVEQIAAANTDDDYAAFPPHFADQQAMYEALTTAGTGITDEDLSEYFKDASFGVRADDIARVYSPHPRVTVIRDASYGVPHIYGETRYATVYAEGYATAEDRLFFMDVLRHLGRGRLSELLGAPAAEMDAETLEVAPYTEDDLEAQLLDLLNSGEEGRMVFDDLVAYADGVNAYLTDAVDAERLPAEYGVLGRAPEPWSTTDAVAIAAYVGAQFGRGGGRELTNACGITLLAGQLGDPEAARAVFDDLHFAEYPASPTTSDREVESGSRAPVDPASVPTLDCGGLRAVGGAADPAGLPEGTGAGAGAGVGIDWSALGLEELAALRVSGDALAASNAILIGGRNTDTGRPIAVFGPQVGYQTPGALVEKDVHGPGIDARGVGFAGIDFYVQLGRGRDFAWSATSSGADNVDTFVLRLCDPAGGPPTVDAGGYERDGVCVPIEAFDHVVETSSGLLGNGDPVTLTWRVERTEDYGPIIRRGTLVDGTPIAVARQRSTYRHELDSAIGFRQLNDPEFMEDGFNGFREATGSGIAYTFNWFYVDATTIGYQHSCRCPVRAPGVDPDLPVFGTGEWDWQGFIEREEQPFEVNPDDGWITSWNNRQAPGDRASDSQFSYGPVQRVQLLDRRIERATAEGRKLDRAAVVELMQDAAVTDLRGAEVLPVVLEVMGTEAPADIDPRVLDLRERLEVWANDGARRQDGDGDLAYEHAVAIAAMDAWWPELTTGVFGSAGQPFATLGLPVDDNPSGHGGSAWNSGSYSHVRHDLGLVLGERPDGGWRTPYCGRAAGGGTPACQQVLWASLAVTVTALEQEFATPDVAAWQRLPADDEIRPTQLVVGTPSMPWVNRPTFQQVVQLETRGAAEPGRDPDRGGGLGFLQVAGLVVLVAAAMAGVGLLVVRRRRSTP